jgi:hypothetical protein
MAFSQKCVPNTNVLVKRAINAMILSIRIQSRMSRFKIVFDNSQCFVEIQPVLAFFLQMKGLLYFCRKCKVVRFSDSSTFIYETNLQILPIPSFINTVVCAFFYILTSLIFGRYMCTLNSLAVVNGEQYCTALDAIYKYRYVFKT